MKKKYQSPAMTADPIAVSDIIAASIIGSKDDPFISDIRWDI